MKKEDMDKVLKEADAKLGNYSDAQHKGQLTISKNRTKESSSKGGKIGGTKTHTNGKGLFAMTEDDKREARSKGANALSFEDKSKGGKIGGLLKRDKGVAILMFDKITNEFIKEFTSIATAARFLGKRENKIRDVLTGRRKTSYGYIWKYKK